MKYRNLKKFTELDGYCLNTSCYSSLMQMSVIISIQPLSKHLATFQITTQSSRISISASSSLSRIKPTPPSYPSRGHCLLYTSALPACSDDVNAYSRVSVAKAAAEDAAAASELSQSANGRRGADCTRTRYAL